MVRLTRAADPGVLHAWGRGWAVSRATPPPVAVPGGFRIDVGLPGHVARYLLPTVDVDTLLPLIAAITEPGTWLKVCAPEPVVRPLLPAGWTVHAPEYLMTATLRSPAVSAPDGYTLATTVTGGAIDVVVRDPAGVLAASGRAGCDGPTAVIDQVETAPEHRRRGLGRVVMAALADQAARIGAVDGVLVATSDGHALYEALGWSTRSHVTPAVLST
ncbi:acetyltransferase (GNAT) family protein [Herbihabitans rhizosphaerae]|uniref:Acetyltransferase (GNAT) family protein n=1 Tax=Herbihabitans rhizosphaerae TaxID=1872711 RepID=A0A4V2ETF2_9PSEU|nr:GNAT family N-acetyltransferase [Herbihabitans rhizosphaerae]RZS40863.1 acetyltransferase (GNAT) family protein [Herbihabitans rhizosphaerae]